MENTKDTYKMTKLTENLTENFFANIAKTLSLAVLKRELPRVIKQVDSDPTLQASLQALKYWSDEAQRQLDNICKRNPESKLCKERKASK